MTYHVPALLKQSVDGLELRPRGVYVDVTFGGGGHSSEILSRLEGGRLIAFDQDEDAGANLISDERLLFLDQNFRFLRNNLFHHGIEEIDGLIADLGVSFHQFDVPERGFSFRFDGPLDMRMSRAGNVTAATVLNSYTEEKLADIFYRYGEISNSRAVARAVVSARESAPLVAVGDLTFAVRALVPPRNENKFFARLFQALRIEVNNELVNLKEMLQQALEMLVPGGRLVVITYHSLEDRLVKNFMRSGSFEGDIEKDFYGNVQTPFRVVTKRAIVAGEEEIAANPRARSAKLRIAEKI
ncbi:MAG: 16S rRNA (cytosine(1402)-N(4))-methyltransferase RsmH [Bacteroidales bacterium]